MNGPALLRPDANRDVMKAIRWYNRKWNGLGKYFLSKILFQLDRIEQTPDLYAIQFADVRCCKVP